MRAVHAEDLHAAVVAVGHVELIADRQDASRVAELARVTAVARKGEAMRERRAVEGGHLVIVAVACEQRAARDGEPKGLQRVGSRPEALLSARDWLAGVAELFDH
eukprot:3626894-Prymnesium_polylepis.1